LPDNERSTPYFASSPPTFVILSEVSRACTRNESKDLQLLFGSISRTMDSKPIPMHQGSYFTYMMASRSRTLYIGMCGDLHKRVFQHKWREHDGFTERYNCDRLVWFETHQDVVRAIEREKQLKGWRREKKIALIERINPAWVDLSRDWYDLEPADYQRSLDHMDN
jgi:putative endonuclease